jgi:hypothetical protein
MNKISYLFLVLLFAMFFIASADAMKRIKDVRTSIAKRAALCKLRRPRCSYKNRATPLQEIKNYFDDLFEEAHEIYKMNTAFLDTMRRIKAEMRLEPTIRAGYIDAIEKLENLVK